MIVRIEIDTSGPSLDARDKAVLAAIGGAHTPVLTAGSACGVEPHPEDTPRPETTRGRFEAELDSATPAVELYGGATLPVGDGVFENLEEAKAEITDVTAVAPPVPPAAVAPPVAPPVPDPPAGVELDGLGLPWDARINASTRTQRKSDNSWKVKRGIDAALVESVRAELTALMGVPAAVAPPVALGAVGVAPPVVPPAAVVPSNPPAVAPVSTYPEFMCMVTSKVGAHTEAADQPSADRVWARVAEELAKVGVPALPMLGARPDLIPALVVALADVL